MLRLLARVWSSPGNVEQVITLLLPRCAHGPVCFLHAASDAPFIFLLLVGGWSVPVAGHLLGPAGIVMVGLYLLADHRASVSGNLKVLFGLATLCVITVSGIPSSGGLVTCIRHNQPKGSGCSVPFDLHVGYASVQC